MSENKNKGDKSRPKVQWTAEDRARHQAIRDVFQNWRPSPEELIATGQAVKFDLHGEYRELRRSWTRSSRPARRLDSPWPRCPFVVASISRPCRDWKTGTTRTRRWTRSGVTRPRSAGAWF